MTNKEELYGIVTNEVARWLNETKPRMRGLTLTGLAIDLVNAIQSEDAEKYLLEKRRWHIMFSLFVRILNLMTNELPVIDGTPDYEARVRRYNSGEMEFRKPTLKEKREIRKYITCLQDLNTPLPWMHPGVGGEVNVSSLVEQLGEDNNED